jgi:hypothetical protein
MSWITDIFCGTKPEPMPRFKERILLPSLVIYVMDAETMAEEIRKRGLDPKWSSFATQYDTYILGTMKDGKIYPDDTRLAHELRHIFSLVNPEKFSNPDKEAL